jgi:hypothetical protein
MRVHDVREVGCPEAQERIMKTMKWMAFALLGLAITAMPSQAASITAGNIVATPTLNQISDTVQGDLALEPGGYLEVQFDGLNSFTNQRIVGTLISRVYRVSSTPTAPELTPFAGGLAFSWQATMSAALGNNTELENLTATLFAPNTVGLGTTALVYYDNDGGEVLPLNVTWTNSGQVDWLFPQSGTGALDGSKTSAELFFVTNSRSFSVGGVTVQDGASAIVQSFAPTPEPSTLALAGLALPLVGLGYLRRRRQG